ncbi:MAG: hypothetical protein Q4F95_03505 [Oscillospiraceae bacterium]|nr:hypothetical protein [Oscillospiraceae bacterium]
MNGNIGYLRVRVFESKKMFPIKNARVEVSRMENGSRKIYANVLTDENGSTGEISLPAMPKSYSLDKMFSMTGEKPYLEYDVSAQAENFRPEMNKKVSIFEDIVSVQSIELILEDISR